MDRCWKVIAIDWSLSEGCGGGAASGGDGGRCKSMPEDLVLMIFFLRTFIDRRWKSVLIDCVLREGRRGRGRRRIVAAFLTKLGW
jgi:hypothetical protein